MAPVLQPGGTGVCTTAGTACDWTQPARLRPDQVRATRHHHCTKEITMFQILRKKRVSIPLAVVAVLAVGGIAYAYWTTTGSGDATGTTGTNSAMTVAQNGVVSAMTPGSPAQAVDYTITNPAATPQYVTTVSIAKVSVTYTSAAGAGTGTTAANHPAGMAAVVCTTADFAVVQPDAVGLDLPAGGTAFTRVAGTTYQGRLSGTVQMLNTASNQDDCKNTTINLTITAA
jgi:hypothetical protein